MAHRILRQATENIASAPFFSILADETADVANREQLVICIRWVDDELHAHEEFIGLHMINTIDAETIFNAIKDTLLRLGLTLAKCRGQCYDGCSTMAGLRSGVATRIKSLEPRCLFTHCHGHALNLACADSVKSVSHLQNAMDTTQEITKLVKYSPKRDTHLEQIRKTTEEDNTPIAIRLLCTTRWTLRAITLESIIQNYSNLEELWEWSLKGSINTETRARVLGVQAVMKKFDFFFGLVLGHLLFQHTDNLSKALQGEEVSAAEGQQIAMCTVQCLERLRTDDKFGLYWKKLMALADEKGVDPPSLPRKRKMPVRYEIGDAPPAEFHTSVEKYYRQIYYEALDMLTTCIKDRFDQKDHRTYSRCESVLLRAAGSESVDDMTDEINEIIDFFGDDFSKFELLLHLETFSNMYKSKVDFDSGSVTFKDIIVFLRSLSKSHKTLISQVIRLTQLVLTMASTNATSERTFSHMRRIKSYLRATTGQQRLNNLMILNIHKEKTDALNLLDVARDFVFNSSHRHAVFGQF